MNRRTHPTLYVLRHGETEWNREGRMQGQTESVLTETGRKHARAQGRILDRLLGDKGTLPWHSSPLLRTRQTVELALSGSEVAVAYDTRLAEIALGSWEGRTRSELAPDFPELADTRLSIFEQCFHAPDGESFDALTARVEDFLDDLTGPAVVVTHGVAGSVLRGRLLGLDFAGMAALEREQGVVYMLENGTERVIREDGAPVSQPQSTV